MVATMENLSERALPKRINDLVSVSQVIMIMNYVVSSIIIIAIIIRRVVTSCGLLVVLVAEKVHRRVIKDLFSLVIGQVDSLIAAEHGYNARSKK